MIIYVCAHTYLSIMDINNINTRIYIYIYICIYIYIFVCISIYVYCLLPVPIAFQGIARHLFQMLSSSSLAQLRETADRELQMAKDEYMASMKDKDGELQTLKDDLRRLMEITKDKDGDLQALKESVAEHHGKAGLLQAIIKDKDETIKHKNGDLDNLREIIKCNAGLLENKEETIKHQERTIAAQATTIAETDRWMEDSKDKKASKKAKKSEKTTYLP